MRELSQPPVARFLVGAFTNERAPLIRVGDRPPLPLQIRGPVLLRDGNRCRWCGESAGRARRVGPDRIVVGRVRVEVDHIVPWSAGGADHPVNLRALCEDCNQWRGNRVADMHTAHALAIAYWCLRCARPSGPGRAIAAWCLTCGVEGTSPFNLVGGRVPTTGVPAAALADVAAMAPVAGQRPVPT